MNGKERASSARTRQGSAVGLLLPGHYKQLIELVEQWVARAKSKARYSERGRRSGYSAPRNRSEAVVRYLAECQGKRSFVNDRDHLRKLDPYLRDVRLDKINMDMLWPFICDRRERDGVVNSTINRALEIVRRILNFAHQDWSWLQRVPRIRMLPEPKRRIRLLTRSEADRLLEEVPVHLWPVVRYGLATGCRMPEILHLEWSRVDFGRRVAWLDPGTTKNGEGRGMP